MRATAFEKNSASEEMQRLEARLNFYISRVVYILVVPFLSSRFKYQCRGLRSFSDEFCIYQKEIYIHIKSLKCYFYEVVIFYIQLGL